MFKKLTIAGGFPPDQHQLKICIDTLKNPMKGQFMGGPSAEEAEKILREKFQFGEGQIQKLKGGRGAPPDINNKPAPKLGSREYLAGEETEAAEETTAASPQIPKGQIEWLVNKLHVGTPDEKVAAEFTKRMGKDPKFTPAIQKQVIDYALKCHKKNQGLYQHVMGGGLGYTGK